LKVVNIVARKISIVVLVYKSRDYILQTLESLNQQSDKDFELVIVDNACPDDSIQLAIDYLKDKAIRYQIVKVDINEGIGKGRMAGIRAANGEYLKFLDSDDLLDEKYVERINRRIEYSSPDIIIYGFRTMNIKGEIIYEVLPIKNEKLATMSLSMFWGYTFKKDLVERSGVDTTGEHLCEDRFFSLGIIPFVKNVVIEKFTPYFYRTGNSNSAVNIDNNNFEKFGPVRKRVLDMYYQLLCKEESKEDAKVIRYVMLRYYYDIISWINAPEKIIKMKEYRLYRGIMDSIYPEYHKAWLAVPDFTYLLTSKSARKVQLRYTAEKLGLIQSLLS
jgi:glycosyltransferase involved in cell wall biosynthesis